ncbi:MAG: nucleotide sugar dehydrogenase [Candidatus Peregrinibacteria bacterium Gr01-1014_25]|nr:MAG: nucleotide sugar dehydrogenase [Candidatus Peregrinibacteria bacterium Gr01-1014_25]
MANPSDVLIIGGFGHVGLPLGIVLADAGLHVSLLDIDAVKRPMIEAGTMPFIEYDAEPLLKKVIGKTLFVADGLADAANSRIVLITIGTPVDEYLSPKTAPLFALADALLPHLTEQHTVVLRSTVCPGTTRALRAHWLARGKDIPIAYCPERIVQGYAIRELRELPQVVSGTSMQAIQTAKELFGRLGVETIDVGTEEAEMSKLFLNAWRYIQFATANQFFVMAREHGLDYDQIYRAMTHHYDRGNIPRPGFAAGPCLLKDTMQLAAAYRNQFFLGHAAMMVNEGLPAFVVDMARNAAGDLQGKTVGILGMAFKKDIDDTRDSLSFKLRKLLQFQGADVLCSDEFAAGDGFIPKEDLVHRADVIIVGVPHSAYRDLTLPAKTITIDLWGVLPIAKR